MTLTPSALAAAALAALALATAALGTQYHYEWGHRNEYEHIVPGCEI